MPFFSKVFKNKEDKSKKKAAPVASARAPQKAQWSDAWLRTRVDPEEVAELIRESLDIPFLLLPFRPSSDPSAARTFVRNYFLPQTEREALRDDALSREVKMTEVMVLASVVKWCWSRLPGGVVTWEAYQLFQVGERDSNFARDAFTTFIPISVDSDARVHIVRDFFDLLAAIAAHGKTNGLGGRKLSRYAGWWAFEHYDTGKGFDAGYKSWANAADATSHLFFAYLRSLSPDSSRRANGILGLPLSLQQLVENTEYPPEDSKLSNETTRVVMIVDVVSPTPYALLRRAKNFEYRDDDSALQQFASYEDPVRALTDECRRVLKAISSANQSSASNSKTSTSLVDPSWSRFEDIGFSSTIEESEGKEDISNGQQRANGRGLNVSPRSQPTNFGRPTTPSWADFLSVGFNDENGGGSTTPAFLPPDKILPAIQTTPRGQSSQSHRRNLDVNQKLEPGELASINKFWVDDAFWWVWISSLAGEEPVSRKAVFGRCALIETILPRGKWMVMEEQVKGAAPEPVQGAYIAEKKGFLGFTTKRGRLTRRRSGVKKSALSTEPYAKSDFDPSSRATLQPDQHARIQQAAAELSRRNQMPPPETNGARRGRFEDISPSKTTSVFTLQPMIKDEASPAMQWASQYDKKAVRAKYLGDTLAGRGDELPTLPPNGLGIGNASATTLPPAAPDIHAKESIPIPPPKEEAPSKALEAPAASIEPVMPTTLPPPPPVQAPEPAALSNGPPDITRESLAERVVETERYAPVSEAEATPAAAIQSASSKPSTPVPITIPPRKSSESPEQKRLKKKSPTPPPPTQKNGIRRLFGTKRSKSREPAPIAARTSRQPPASPTGPVETNPAILAARRALEGKSDRPTDPPRSPPMTQEHFNKLRTVNAPVMATQTVHVPQQAPAPPVASVEEHQHPDADAVAAPAAVSDKGEPGPPRTRRDEEYDNLSRVDTNEREHADREFSTFDQGPLLDQPAFVPSATPEPAEFFTPAEEEPPRHITHPSIHSAVTVQTATTDDETPRDEMGSFDLQQVSASDRWAQIRKNAAERAARMPEDAGPRGHTETRTDDGETSGEETIESRVARIKARVAELTGNMEQTRR